MARKNKKGKQQAPEPRSPRILALETATGVSSVALFEEDRLLGLLEFHANKLHARLITVMIEQLLAGLDTKPDELAAIAVAKGPGSYTGLRVGVSTAKGLCMALDKPLIGVGSLEALAVTVRDFARAADALIVPMIDARRMEVFCQVLDADLQPQGPTEAKVLDAESFAAGLAARKHIFVGDGAAKAQALLSVHGHAIVLPERLSSAAGMGTPAWRAYQAQQFEDLITFEPFYLKSFVATKPKKKVL